MSYEGWITSIMKLSGIRFVSGSEEGLIKVWKIKRAQKKVQLISTFNNSDWAWKTNLVSRCTLISSNHEKKHLTLLNWKNNKVMKKYYLNIITPTAILFYKKKFIIAGTCE